VALELLGRTNSKTTGFEQATIERLASSLANTALNDGNPDTRFKAFGALLAAGTVDQTTIRTALKDDSVETRRRAVTILGGTGVPSEEDERVPLIQERLGDESPNVRFDAVRASARHTGLHGCAPLLELLADHDSHVVIATLDAIGDVCATD